MNTDLFIQRDAAISDCGKYRWSLSRCWKETSDRDWLGWIMLNPSVADAGRDDPTIRRCMAFAKDWGFNGIAVRNLFALRATDPTELYKAADPVGIVDGCPLVIAAWGTLGSLRGRDRQVIDLFVQRGVTLKCLGKTQAGHPRHPLYVPANAKLEDFALAQAVGGGDLR